MTIFHDLLPIELITPTPHDNNQSEIWVNSNLTIKSDDRRIGLNAKYLAPHVKQTEHDCYTDMLVRGVDKGAYFGLDVEAKIDLDPVALCKQKELDELYRKTADSQPEGARF